MIKKTIVTKMMTLKDDRIANKNFFNINGYNINWLQQQKVTFTTATDITGALQ